MAFAKMKKVLTQIEMEQFHKFGLVFYPEVIVSWWDPYSIAADPPKTYWQLENAWLRFYPDGKVTLGTLEHSYYISKQLADHLAKEDVPLHHLEYSDVYESKLSADLAKKPLREVTEIEIHGAVLPYGQSILQSLIIEVITKFGRKQAATRTQIIDFLTKQLPYGGGWLKRTVALITKVEETLEIMVNKGKLDYNEKTHEYTVTEKATTTTLRGAK